MRSSRNIGLQSFFTSVFIFFGICLLYYIGSVSKTNGHYVYPLDDAYIHLAIAKNFALHNVWGITKYQFSSTSSAPLFTFILSWLIKVFGNNDQIPLYFNVIFSLGIIYCLSIYYAGIFKNMRRAVFAVVFTLLFAVLHLQMLSGMEHIFQVFLFIVNIFCFYHWDKNRWAILGFYLTILLMGLVRFESMFYFIILAFVFILIRKWKGAIGVLMAGFVPILIFCYFNYQQDGYFFPNSVVVKGTKLSLDSNILSQLRVIFFDNFLLNISFYKIGVFPILLCMIFIYRDLKTKTFKEVVNDNFFPIVFSLVMICHAMFADLKGMFRYEAYILLGFSMSLIPKMSGLFFDFKNYIKREKIITLFIIINILLLCYKGWMAHRILENGGKNIYEQQIQSARFLHTYYNNSKVVANDIGAITYYTDIHLLDIVGLGSIEMIPFNENRNLLSDKFESFLTEYSRNHHYEIAVIYDEWFQGHVPKTWKKVAVLKIRHIVTASKDEVSIYSIDPANLEMLKKNIQSFNWNKNVEVKILD